MGHRGPAQCTGRTGQKRIKQPRVIIVGARTARQGTGPFIAGAFSRLGADVCAIVGTTEASNEEARATLEREYGIQCSSYTQLREALDTETPDAVALCSPYPYHSEQLQLAAAANCHVLVEKPMMWPATEAQVAAIVEDYRVKNLYLQVVAQWPETLTAFSQLHGELPSSAAHFEMRLSPISIGSDMVPDSAPHFISMLQTLLGTGDFEEIQIDIAPGHNRLEMQCQYRHQRGSTSAILHLETSNSRPRPAWYQIDHNRVDREVILPEYKQQLVSDGHKASFEDPLEGVVAKFLTGLKENSCSGAESILTAQRNLTQLMQAWSGTA